MKKVALVILLFFVNFSFAQSAIKGAKQQKIETVDKHANGKVGINNAPKATLDIGIANVNLDSNTNEGILIPRVTRERLMKMGSDKAIEVSMLVYVNDVSTQENIAGTKAEKVTEEGFYYYDGKYWVPLSANRLEEKINILIQKVEIQQKIIEELEKKIRIL